MKKYIVQAQRKKNRIARAKQYLKRYQAGESMADIGREFGISRQRVRALITSLETK
jgi:hypothetical protein